MVFNLWQNATMKYYKFMPPCLAFVLIGSALSAGCHSSMAPPASQPAPSPLPTPSPVAKVSQTYESKNAGISFLVPAGWKQTPVSDTQVRFDSPGPAKISVTLDVPRLPWHPYGLIPINSVRDGYVDDQRKKMPDAQTTNLPDPSVPEASQRRVKISGHLNGNAVVDDAVLLVHGDRVYILSLDCDNSAYPSAKATLESVVQTLHWAQK
jgi:hypothetical protein